MVQSVHMGGREYTKKGIDLEKALSGCRVKQGWGRYSRIRNEKNPMHDRAWDALINDNTHGENRMRIQSFIPDLFSAYKRKGTPYSGAAWARVLLRDKARGRAASKIKIKTSSGSCSGCGCSGSSYKTIKFSAITGQLKAFASVTSQTSVHDGLKAEFSFVGKNPQEQFKNYELLVAGNDEGQLKALNNLAAITNEATLKSEIMKIRDKAYAYGMEDGIKAEEGLADAAALLAAGALRKIASLRDQSSKKCKDLKYTADIKFWTERASKWLKIARRLAHEGDALHYARLGMEAAADPLFMEKQSSFACTDPKVQAMMLFSAGGDALTISGPVKAFLKSSHEAAFGCTGRGGKIKTGSGCPPGMKKMTIRGKKVCRPKYCKHGRLASGWCKKKGGMKIQIDVMGTNPNG